MSATSATSGTTAATSGTLGDAAPVSFPGIASGIDYNSIIEKYTADTLLQEKPDIAQVNNLNSQNTAILKITNLIGAVQDSLTALSNPTIFNAYKATVNNTSSGSPAATASQISGQTPVAGTYVINAQTIATQTSIVNNPGANAALLTTTAALDAAGTSITPTNGTASNGVFTINGIALNYDVTVQTASAIVAEINTALNSSDGGSATLNANGTVTLTGVTSIGSGADSGNLEQVLKLDTAQLVPTGGGQYTVTSSSDIAGLNSNEVLAQTDNAGFATQVTSGTFTINGVQLTINANTDTLGDVIAQINSSSAGVTATYNAETSSLSLTSKTAGPQTILLGAGSDTSNFLKAAGFLANGAVPAGTTTAGTQASLIYTNQQGVEVTAYSATNDFTNAIPGIDLNISASGGAAGSTFYTVSVASDPTQAEGAINTFIKAYNAALVELNKDTAAPTVQAGTDASTGTANSTSSGGGVLYGNYQISGLRDQLVNLVSGFIPSGSQAYNSLQSVGVLLDTNSQEVGTDAADSTDSDTSKDTSSSANNSFTVNATSGQLQALDTTTFAAAYANDSSAVANLFTLAPVLSGTQSGAPPVAGATYGFSYLLGSTLANIDGLSTFLNNSVVTPDNLANVLLTNITDSNNQQIDSLEQQISIVNKEATQQADNLRTQFTASESQIAELQALQSQIAAIGH